MAVEADPRRPDADADMMPAQNVHLTQARRSLRLRRWVAAFYVLASLLVGFAHRPIILEPAPKPHLTAYALPDGTLPPICSGQNGSGKKSDRLVPAACAACTLTAAPGLPCGDDLSLRPPALVTHGDAVAPGARSDGVAVHLPPARAPPEAFARS